MNVFFILLSLVIFIFPLSLGATEYTFIKAFAFGENSETQEVTNAPDNNYIKLYIPNPLAYGSLYEDKSVYQDYVGFKNHLGYGYSNWEPLNPLGGLNRDKVTAASEEIYDQFISAGEGDATFRINVPNGQYRFVAAGGDMRWDTASTLKVRNGSGGETHFLINNSVQTAGYIWRVGFEDKIPPPEDGDGKPYFLDLTTSPILNVTSGYIELIHIGVGSALRHSQDEDFDNAYLCLFEVWAVSATYQTVSIHNINSTIDAGNLTSAQFQIKRSSDAGSLTVYYEAGGDAVPGTDYVTLPGSYTFQNGQSSTTINITPINSNELRTTNIITIGLLTYYNGAVEYINDPYNSGLFTYTISNRNIAGKQGVSQGSAKIYGGQKGGVKPAEGEYISVIPNVTSSGNITLTIYTLSGTFAEEKVYSFVKGTDDILIYRPTNLPIGTYIMHINGCGVNDKKKFVVIR